MYKHIPQHNNLSPTSLLITLTVFVASATNSPIYKPRPGSYLRSERVRCDQNRLYVKQSSFSFFVGGKKNDAVSRFLLNWINYTFLYFMCCLNLIKT